MKTTAIVHMTHAKPIADLMSEPARRSWSINGVTFATEGTDAELALFHAAPRLLAVVEARYAELADIENEWPGRDTHGQATLIELRNLIAAATGRTQQDVQDDFSTRLMRARRLLAQAAEPVGSPA